MGKSGLTRCPQVDYIDLRIAFSGGCERVVTAGAHMGVGTLGDGPTSPGAPTRHFRLKGKHAVGLVLALLVVGVGSVLVYVNSYQPLEAGSFGLMPSGALKTVTDGITAPTTSSPARRARRVPSAFRYKTRAPSGIGSRPRWLRPGRRLLAMGSGSHRARRVHRRNAGDLSCLPRSNQRRWADSVYVIVRRPACDTSEETGFENIPLLWEALGVNHVYTVS